MRHGKFTESKNYHQTSRPRKGPTHGKQIQTQYGIRNKDLASSVTTALKLLTHPLDFKSAHRLCLPSCPKTMEMCANGLRSVAAEADFLLDADSCYLAGFRKWRGHGCAIQSAVILSERLSLLLEQHYNSQICGFLKCLLFVRAVLLVIS